VHGPADRKPREASGYRVLRRQEGGHKKIEVIVLECRRARQMTDR